MDKTEEAEEAKFYLKDNDTEVINVFFSREDFIEHLSSMVLIYNKDVFVKTRKEKE